MNQKFLWNGLDLPGELVFDIRRMNPWWEGARQKELPGTRRFLVDQMKRQLNLGLAPIVVVRGPRQIGKTISQLQLLQDFLDSGISAKNIFRVQIDELPSLAKLGEPILRLVDWYEHTILGKSLNDAAHSGEKTYLFFDEVQNVKDWAPQLKSLVDHSTTQVVVTGSSALRIEMGRDSLAGRISTIEAGVLSLTEIGSFRAINTGEPCLGENNINDLTKTDFWKHVIEQGKSRAEARNLSFRWFSERGGYPLAHQKKDVGWPDLASQLNETIVRRVIKHDLRFGEKGRKRDEALLEEMFKLACRYAGQAPAPATLAREVQLALNANVGAQRANHYLKFLGDTLLLRLIEPLEIRLKKKRGNSKICLADHSLRASWLQEIVPLDPDKLSEEPHLTKMAGHIAESVVGATLSSIKNLGISHFPERTGEPEVDFVLTIGEVRIPMEVKYHKRIDPMRDTEGLRAFIERKVNNAPFGLLVSQTDTPDVYDPRIITLPLSSLMLIR